MSQERLENYVNNPSNISFAKRALKQKGNKNPTSEDIGKFLTDEFQKSKDKKGSDLGRLIGGGCLRLNRLGGLYAGYRFIFRHWCC